MRRKRAQNIIGREGSNGNDAAGARQQAGNIELARASFSDLFDNRFQGFFADEPAPKRRFRVSRGKGANASGEDYVIGADSDRVIALFGDVLSVEGTFIRGFHCAISLIENFAVLNCAVRHTC